MSRAESIFTLPPEEIQKSEEPFVLGLTISPDGFSKSFSGFLTVNLPTVKEGFSSGVTFSLFNSEQPTPEMIEKVFVNLANKAWERFKRSSKYREQTQKFLTYATDFTNNRWGTSIELDLN